MTWKCGSEFSLLCFFVSGAGFFKRERKLLPSQAHAAAWQSPSSTLAASNRALAADGSSRSAPPIVHRMRPSLYSWSAISESVTAQPARLAASRARSSSARAVSSSPSSKASQAYSAWALDDYLKKIEEREREKKSER